MSNNIENIRTIAEALIEQQFSANRPSPQNIQEKIELAIHVLAIKERPSASEIQTLRRVLEAAHTMHIGKTAELRGEDQPDEHEDWYKNRKVEISAVGQGMRFWNNFRSILKKREFEKKAIDVIDATTDRVLELIEDPHREGIWARRGMVVGHVQSGKTSNYTALVCKAADCGYRLIVILAGNTDSLRYQTQNRIDEDFIGYDTSQHFNHGGNEALKRIGVGLSANGHPAVCWLTDSDDKGDFKAQVARNRSRSLKDPTPLILVIKKNASILKNFHNWIATVDGEVDPDEKNAIKATPLFLIDDEADHSSIDTNSGRKGQDGRDDYDPTRINGEIRKILRLFSRSVYVAYTATPFANIYINSETDDPKYGSDLYPKNFIIRIPPPSNHIGPTKVFGLIEQIGNEEEREGLDIIREIDDHQSIIPDGHKSDFQAVELPNSLKEAIRAFILSCAARSARGQQSKHNSMLIHVTRYNEVQRSLHELVQEEFNHIKNGIIYGSESGGSILNVLKQLWDTDFDGQQQNIASIAEDSLVVPVSWIEVKSNLHLVVEKTKVKSINGKAGDVLDYKKHKEGINIIAIGGDKLSRGLTLEGLTVSYYLRASRMYDTLLQMGRWFGYRKGYIDLCRLYTTPQLISWFQYIALANEELHQLFEVSDKEGRTPLEFCYRVRTHPAGLHVTAPSKSRNSSVRRISCANTLAETFAIPTSSESRQRNIQQLDRFLSSIDCKPEKIGVGFTWKVQGREVSSFLRNIQTSPRAPQANGYILADYIEKMLNHKELTDWTVLLASNTKTKTVRYFELKETGIKIGLTSRGQQYTRVTQKVQKGMPCSTNDTYLLNGFHIIDPPHEAVDLSKTDYDIALEETIRDWKQNGTRPNQPKSPNPIHLRKRRDPKCGLLILYLLDANYKDAWKGHPWADDTNPYFGFAVSFPHSNNVENVEYRTDNQFLKCEIGFDPDEEEVGNDDG